MAGEKTEKPTHKRIQDARGKGQVAKSTDLNSAITLSAAALALSAMGAYAFSTLYGIMKHSFSQLLRNPPLLHTMSDHDFTEILNGTLKSIGLLVAPILLSVMTLGVLANLVQVRPLFAPAALQPKLEKINPLSGFKRLFSTRSAIEVLKALLKMGVIGAAGYLIVQKHWTTLIGLSGLETAVAWQAILSVLGEIMQWACVLFLVMGLLDWRYQAWQLERQLRMSRQDIKDEHKSQDGDPMMKNRIRANGAKIAKSRHLAAVPTADVVITNPTHYAIALKYDPDIAPAPVVVAKGKDHFAQKIKEIAKANNVPMVENKPLARALFPVVEAEAMIPPELFVAVAEVLAYVFAKSKGRKLPKPK